MGRWRTPHLAESLQGHSDHTFDQARMHMVTDAHAEIVFNAPAAGRHGGFDCADERPTGEAPPATGRAFGPAECEQFVETKERIWAEHGYGPWAFVIRGEFAGWGGLQPEGEDIDLGLMPRPKFWGWGPAVLWAARRCGCI